MAPPAEFKLHELLAGGGGAAAGTGLASTAAGNSPDAADASVKAIESATAAPLRAMSLTRSVSLRAKRNAFDSFRFIGSPPREKAGSAVLFRGIVPWVTEKANHFKQLVTVPESSCAFPVYWPLSARLPQRKRTVPFPHSPPLRLFWIELPYYGVGPAAVRGESYIA